MKRLCRSAVLMLTCLCAPAATIVTISSRVEVSVTDFRGTFTNSSSASSSTNDFTITGYSMPRPIPVGAVARAGGSPTRGETEAFARITAEWGVSSARAVAETVYQRQFDAAAPFQARPLNFIPELIFFEGMYNSAPHLVRLCVNPLGCDPPRPVSTAGTGTIEFEQSLNGVLLNSVTLRFSLIDSVGTLTENSCRPQPNCQILNAQLGFDTYGDPMVYSPAQWLVGPMAQVQQGTNFLEYKIRAVAEGSFAVYRGIQVHYGDPVTLSGPYPAEGTFQWQTPGTASTVPEPGGALAGLGLLLGWARYRFRRG